MQEEQQIMWRRKGLFKKITSRRRARAKMPFQVSEAFGGEVEVIGHGVQVYLYFLLAEIEVESSVSAFRKFYRFTV
jgi:hypothetical protein